MKICPLVTQVAVLEEKDLLVGELDDSEINSEKTAEQDSKDSPFVNPERNGETLDLIKPPGKEVPVRFIAKSFRSRIECLGELCRFYDTQAASCRFESAFGASRAGATAEELRSILSESSSGERRDESIRTMLAEVEAKQRSSLEEQRASFEQKIEELRKFMETGAKERNDSLEAFSLTLDARSEEIERKIENTVSEFTSLRKDLSEWKNAIEKNIGALESQMEDTRRLVSELHANNSAIVKLVENQKQTMEEHEKRRKTAEAKRHNNAGVLAYHNGQYEKALENFRKAIEIDPGLIEAYNNLGLAYTEINEEKLAIEAFKKAIELAPELAAAYNNLGYVFYRLGSYTEAIEMYNQAIGREKNNASAYTNLGNALYKLKKIDEAIEAWKKALSLDPANEKARRNLERFHAEVS